MHTEIYIAPTIYVAERDYEKMCSIAIRHGILYYCETFHEEGSNTVLEVKLYKIDGWPIRYKVWDEFKEDCEKEGVEIF